MCSTPVPGRKRKTTQWVVFLDSWGSFRNGNNIFPFRQGAEQGGLVQLRRIDDIKLQLDLVFFRFADLDAVDVDLVTDQQLLDFFHDALSLGDRHADQTGSGGIGEEGNLMGEILHQHHHQG